MKQNALLREMAHRIKRAEDRGIQIGMYTTLKLVENVLPTVEGIGEKRAIAIEEALKKRIGELMEEIRNDKTN